MQLMKARMGPEHAAALCWLKQWCHWCADSMLAALLAQCLNLWHFCVTSFPAWQAQQYACIIMVRYSCRLLTHAG
jgi:hypothetical protein